MDKIKGIIQANWLVGNPDIDSTRAVGRPAVKKKRMRACFVIQKGSLIGRTFPAEQGSTPDHPDQGYNHHQDGQGYDPGHIG